jgi:hypothetical protein
MIDVTVDVVVEGEEDGEPLSDSGSGKYPLYLQPIARGEA